MSKLNFTTLVFCLFFGISTVISQTDPQNKVALARILDDIEKQYEVTFTFADATIQSIRIVPPGDIPDLQNLLFYLEEKSGLRFQLIGGSNIIVRAQFGKGITSTQFLDEVLVVNYLTKGISLKNGGVTNLKPKEFGILPGLIEPDVLTTIQALPGVISVEERVSNLNVRGGTHDQNLILWDGIKMYQSGHFFGLISAFNPYLTEDVVLYKNGTSAVYGDGVSSIIDMRNSDERQNEFTGGAGVNLISADAFAKIPTGERSELQISSRRSITDLLITPTYDQYFKRIFQDTDITNQGNTTIAQNERFYFYDASAKFIYDLSDKDQFSINGLSIYNNLDYDERSTVNDVNEALNSNLIQKNLAAGINYRRKWNSKLTTTAQAHLSYYDLDATNFDVINNQRLIQENKVFDGGFKLHVDYELEDNLKYQGGYQFTEVGISNLEDVNNPVFRRFIKEVLRTHSLFNEVTFSSNSKNTFARIGLRTNYIEKFSEFYIEPRLSFSQKFLDHFRLEIQGELKSQTTSQIIDLQNDFLGVEKRRWILSNNESIPVIRSKQFSTGIHYNRNRLVVSLEGYIKDVEGITSRSQGFQNQYQFLNTTGSYRIRGFDFLVNKQWDQISTWLGYSFSKNEYTFNDLNFGRTFPNNNDIRHAVTFAGTYSLNRFKLAVGLNWHSGRPFTQPLETTPVSNALINYADPNSSNLDDYLRLDISATYNFKLTKKLDGLAGISIWNITDRNNVINTYYVLNDQSTINKIENRSLGLTPNVSFRIKF